MGYKQSFEELRNQWETQIKFLVRSCEYYDKGDFDEAKRIATSLRILFHNTKKSKSLLNQLNLTHNLVFWSSSSLYTPSNLVSSWTLLLISFNRNEVLFKPILLDVIGRTFYLNFEDWWNEIIFDDKSYFLCRRDIVLSIANQDGGAHVDPTLDEPYANLAKKNSLGVNYFNETHSQPHNNPAYASIRQIACEVLKSISLQNISFTRVAYQDRKFEVRFVDDSRRFKWSSTDLDASVETMGIVNRYKASTRKYYIDRLNNGDRREVIC